ncbi:MAG: Sphingosine-1-phosphate phosphatase 2 [Phylliscum demangeonii]|nr:MAG: Sphingosine-1-phosphate phosphatase 2 [Phylliscum demangeonii]
MSGSAALEYGFPSTHSTNAVSIAVYAALALQSATASPSSNLRSALGCILFVYTASITFGRVYCGMHGFLDVLSGSLLGAVLACIEFQYGRIFNELLFSSSYTTPLLLAIVMCLLIWIHPEPADDCPCFDDSVAFAGVMIGLEFGHWQYARSGWGWDQPVPATVPFDLQALGWAKATLRIMLGVVTIFLWRGVMKPTLLRSLPPLFRLTEKLGMDLPRRFFIQASQYKRVPPQLKDDDVIPSVSQISSSLMASMRNPRRRAISIGPQSAADVYEAMAYQRNKPRHENGGVADCDDDGDVDVHDARAPAVSSSPVNVNVNVNGNVSVNRDQRTGRATARPGAQPSSADNHNHTPNQRTHYPGHPAAHEPSSEALTLSHIKKTRVRYDVEVVTKLIIYAGIAWVAVVLDPVLFEAVGLGMGRTTSA